MNKRELSYFLEVYHEHSIAAAARNLMITPQGLSKTILSMEEQLGAPLFLREGRKMVPTSMAVNLVPHARNVLSELTLIENRGFIDATGKKELFVPVCYDVMPYLTVDFFSAFHQKYPNTILCMNEFPEQLLTEFVNQNRYEIAIVTGPVSTTLYTAVYLFSADFYILTSVEHPLASKDAVSFAELDGYPMIIKSNYSPSSIGQISEALANGSHFNTIMEMSDLNMIEEMVVDNQAIGFTLSYMLNYLRHPEKVRAIPITSKNHTKDVYLISNPGAQLSGEAGEFADFLKEWMSEIKREG